jgi:hypothetical protein
VEGLFRLLTATAFLWVLCLVQSAAHPHRHRLDVSTRSGEAQSIQVSVSQPAILSADRRVPHGDALLIPSAPVGVFGPLGFARVTRGQTSKRIYKSYRLFITGLSPPLSSLSI